MIYALLALVVVLLILVWGMFSELQALRKEVHREFRDLHRNLGIDEQAKDSARLESQMWADSQPKAGRRPASSP